MKLLTSYPLLHSSQWRQESASHLIPTASPTLRVEGAAPGRGGPMKATYPDPSCPPTRGSLFSRGQSPSQA